MAAAASTGGGIVETRALQVGGRVAAAALLAGGDLGLGRRQAALARHDLLYAFPQPDAVPQLVKEGWRKLGETRRFTLTLRHGPFLRAKLGRVAAAAGAPGLDLARAASVAAGAARAGLRHRLEWPTDADERLDGLWAAARGEYPVACMRNAAFVHRYVSPRLEGEAALAVLVSRRTGALEGYAVVARAGSVAHLRDVFGTRAALPALLRLVAGTLLRQGAESLSVRLSGAPALVTCLSFLGFREHADGRPVIIDIGPSLDDARADVQEVDRWLLTEADEAR